MSDREDEAYTELCLENERLRGLLEKVDVSVEKLKHCKALCARAADRIYLWVDAGLDPSIETQFLIDELRKAAE